jgi:hypothetical protein
MVGVVFIISIIVVIAYLIYSSNRKAPKITIQAQVITEREDTQPQVVNTESAGSGDRYNDPDIKIIRDEIRAAVAAHSAAVMILQSLARIDGTTSEAERNLVFEFLNRQGAELAYDKHRPWFYYASRSGEWYRAAELAECDEMIASIMPLPLPYRIDVYATALAIVAVGGTPKKREAEVLKRLKKLIETQG